MKIAGSIHAVPGDFEAFVTDSVKISIINS